MPGPKASKSFKPGANYGIESETTMNTDIAKFNKYEKKNMYDFDGDGQMDAEELKRRDAANKRALAKHDAAVKKALASDAAGGAGQYTTVGSSLAVTTSANVKSEYGIAEVSMYDFDGDGQLDAGAEVDAARKAHQKAVKERMKAEKAALAKQNRELKKRRDHMRYVADEGVKTDDIDYLNDDDEDAEFWRMRHKIAEASKEIKAEEAAHLKEENKVYRMRVKNTEHLVDSWASDQAWGPIGARKADEAQISMLLSELRTAVHNMLHEDTDEEKKLSTALMTYSTQRAPETAGELQPLEDKLAKVNELLGPNYMFPLTLSSKQFHEQDAHVLEPHKLYCGGVPIKNMSRVSLETELGGAPTKMLMDGSKATFMIK